MSVSPMLASDDCQWRRLASPLSQDTSRLCILRIGLYPEMHSVVLSNQLGSALRITEYQSKSYVYCTGLCFYIFGTLSRVHFYYDNNELCVPVAGTELTAQQLVRKLLYL